MSEAQAIETETEIDIVEDETALVDESAEGEKPEDDAIEIKVEEAGEPPARRLSGFEKRLRKKSEQVSQAEAEAEALREENKLLRMAQEQKTETLEEPNESDFDLGSDDPEYRTAVRKYDKAIARQEAREEARELLKEAEQKTAQASQVQLVDNSIAEHYARADSLKVKNYDELENNATDILGEDFVKTLIASTDDSHRILASMGASPGKTAQIAQLIKTNPVKAFASALRFEINSALTPASLKTAPDPEETVDPGRGVTSTTPGLEGVKFE